MTSPTPQALLFDVGGVLLDIDFDRALRAWAPYSALPRDELQKTYAYDHQFRRHECGEMTAGEYFDYIGETLRLNASREQIAAGWNAIFVGEITRTRLLVESARKRLPCFAFTNTNASHMATWSGLFPEVAAAFDRIFASHEIGLRKPEPASFEYVCQATGLAPEAFLFFDDLAENVQAARAVGLQAVLVQSPEDVARALTRAFAGAP
jgi:putative hydrolase of the HAD superfamily